MSWQQAIQLWTYALRSAGRRPQTIVLYRHYANYLADRLGGSPWAATDKQLEALIGSAEWGVSGRKTLRTVVGGFYRWGHARGYIALDPAAGLDAVKVPRGRPRPTPDAVVDQALAEADERDWLMVVLGAECGLRAGEISQVHTDDLDDDDNLLVHGKGGKERLVPVLDEELAAAIRRAHGWLFPNVQRGGHLTANYVSKRLSRLLAGNWTGHSLRHRYGTKAFAIGRDLLAVSELLGHASTETTRVYVMLPADHLRAAARGALIDRTRPRPNGGEREAAA